MLISGKQQEANRQNAQHSTGPATPESKAAVRLNALTYGLRARDLLLPNEDPEEYKQLWAGLEAEWQPQTCTERLHLEQMATSQWLLARYAKSERSVNVCETEIEKRLPLLGRVSALRARAERSFTSAMHELKQLQKERQARTQPQPAQPAHAAKATQSPVHKPAEPPSPRPDYKMSEDNEAHPVLCATPDTR
jgi:hypothetical protein